MGEASSNKEENNEVESNASEEKGEPSKEIKKKEKVVSPTRDRKKKAADRYVNTQGITFFTERSTEAEDTEKRPCSTRVLVRLLNFFCKLVNPNDSKNPLYVRLLGLNTINTIVELKGASIAKIPQLLNFVLNDLCKVLFQVLQKVKKDENSILIVVLRIIFNLFVSLGSHMKFQIGAFFSIAMYQLVDEYPPLEPRDILPIEQREIIFETLISLFKEPTFLVDTYLNFDCDPQLDNILGNFVDFCYKNAGMKEDKERPNSTAYLRTLSLEAYSVIINSMFNRSKITPSAIMPNLQISVLMDKKQYKNILQEAAEFFNIPENPQFNNCFEYLQQNKLLPSPLDPKSLALMFRKNTFLSKKNLGEYLAKNKEFNIQVLEEYAKSFDFKGKTYLQCIREFFESYRIVGESAIIERSIEKVNEHFMNSNNSFVTEDTTVNSDSLYILTYSVIMLNVELHSPVLADKPGGRMTLDQYKYNLRGLNQGKDFPPQFLSNIYTTVQNDEIKIHKQRMNFDLSDSTWNHLYTDAKLENQLEFLLTRDSASHYDALVFNSLWKKLIGTLKHTFLIKNQELTEKVVANFTLCALLSSHFDNTHSMDFLISTLCDLTTILGVTENFYLSFGKNEKAQTAMSTLFQLSLKHGDHIRDSWKNVMSCLLKLHSFKLLPKDLVNIEDPFTWPEENIEPPKEAEATSLSKLAFGLFSGTSSWLIGDSQSKTTETPEKKLKVKIRDSVKQCKLDHLISSSQYLSTSSLLYWIKVLVSGASVHPSNSPAKTETTDQQITLCLDILTKIALLNRERIYIFWPTLADYFETQFASTLSSNVLYKVATNLFILALNFLSETSIRNSILISLLKLIKKPYGNTFAEVRLKKKICIGINKVLMANVKFLKTSMEWEHVSELIRWTMNSPTTTKDGFEVLFYIVTCSTLEISSKKGRITQDPKTLVSTENYSLMMDLISLYININDFYIVKCLELLQHVISVIPGFCNVRESGLEPEEKDTLELYWIPAFQYLCQLCRDNRNVDIQNHSISALQRALLAPELFVLSAESWSILFEKILFPLLQELLKAPQEPTVKKEEFDEIRLRAANILCKTFLQYRSKLISYNNFNHLWSKVLKYIKLYMEADKKRNLAEAITEALKNILMVMHTDGILRPPTEETDIQAIKYNLLWNSSWDKISKFCPNLKAEFMLLIQSGNSTKNFVNINNKPVDG
eukprot:TRINITY_DN1817_c0_g2_i1.p1 TRINITY_DN1817_c0_g2~~TRINITY_DN1817_c0_g2_i1.p1  ORF type:complete len:1224 (-),score=341.78 TRINITY_DN1817_c0_g2_i1:78-3695(-)